jgi:TRAP-type C4-dicarboxylate transport system substrate-binding protein
MAPPSESVILRAGKPGHGLEQARMRPNLEGDNRMSKLSLWSAMLATALAAAPAAAQAPIPLRVTGHFSQNTRQVDGIERPFYAGLPQATGINLAITFNPMDVVGVQAADALRLIRSGAFDIMAVLTGQIARDEPFFDGLDLIGVSANLDEAKQAVDAGREAFDRRLQERFGGKVLTLWPFGPQVFFCNHPVRSVADLRGLKIRSYTPSMSALVQQFGGTPVTLQFSEVYPALQRGVVTCGITSATSAYTGNWGEVTTHILPLSLAGGIQAHIVNLNTWRRFSPEQQEALSKAFAGMEQQFWDLARTGDNEALACLTGSPDCQQAKRFNATLSSISEADQTLLRTAVSSAVLPTFRDSCNRVWNQCTATWNRTVGQARGYTIE